MSAPLLFHKIPFSMKNIISVQNLNSKKSLYTCGKANWRQLISARNDWVRAKPMRALGEYQRAIEIAQRLLSLDRADEEAFQHIIFCYLALGIHSAAADQYQACIRVLQEELGVKPSPATIALAGTIANATTARASAARRTNLPIPPTSLIGRQEEVAEIISLLSERHTRLLTLTGAGGSNMSAAEVVLKATGLTKKDSTAPSCVADAGTRTAKGTIQCLRNFRFQWS